MPNPSIADRLESLPLLSKPVLAELWRQLLKTNPPPRMRKELMIRVVAYRLQEQEFGGLSENSHRRILEFAKAVENNAKSAAFHRPAIKPGTRLIRQWQGQVHVVNVEDGNYEYRGARYDSLSEIARFITGTRWSGPFFFGLKPKPILSERPDELRF